MTRHQRPALTPASRATLAAAYDVLLRLATEHPRTRIAGDADTARHRLGSLLGYDQAIGRVLVDRAELDRIAGAQPLTESELRLMHGDR